METSDPGLGPSGGLKCFLFMTDVANLVIFVTISNRWHSSDFCSCFGVSSGEGWVRGWCSTGKMMFEDILIFSNHRKLNLERFPISCKHKSPNLEGILLNPFV